MKKALSLLLVLAMLATMGTVPVFAEDETLDLPLIEEVTEEEMEEEVEIFGEIAEGETSGETNVPNVSWNTFVPAEDDGVTYFTEMEGSSVSVFNVVTASTQGNLASITNGIYTTGVEIENPSANSKVDHYPVVNNAVEGFMGVICKNALTIDLGAEKTFAGIRLVDDHKARAMKARKATRAYISISSDGTNWTTVDRTDAAVTRAADYATTYSDFFFKRLNREVNLTARYIRVYVANVNTHDQYDIEEIIMLDADSAKDTYNTVTAKDYYDFDENWEIEVGSNLGGSSAGKLIDGVIFGGQGNCWHSIANAEGHTYTEADKTVTITFDEPTEIGGVRIFPRTDGAGASPNTIKLLGTLDGVTWHTIWASKTLGFSSHYMEGNEVFFPFGREYPLMGLKVISLAGIDTNMKQYTNYTELQLLKPALPTAQDPDFHVFPDDEVTMGLPMGTFKTYGVKEGAADTVIRNTDVGYKAMEGIALTSAYFKNNGSPGGGFGTYQLHHDYGVGGTPIKDGWKYNSIRAIYDMGKVYEFSGIRFYQRVSGNQNITGYYLSVSDDGENWVKLDKSTLSNAVVATSTSFAFDGSTVNLKARYLKFDIVSTASGHWGLEEIRLINPKSGLATKTAADLKAETDAKKGNINAVINTYEPYNVTLDNASAIFAAKEAYDALREDLKADIDGDKLDTLYNAAIELSHNVRVNKYGLTDPSATNHNGQKGFRNIDYTLYVNDVEGEEPVTVTGLSYLDEAISNNYDRWKAVNNGDGTVTLTLGGNYWNDPDWKNWIEGPMTASIKSYEDTGYYYKTVNAISNYTKDPLEIRPESFTGTLVREITMKDEGDHYLTVTLSDGTKKEIILSSEYVWTNVPSTAVLGERDADAIKPSSSWKFATNLYAEGTVTSRGNALFNGVYNAEVYSETWTMGGNYYTAFDAEGKGTTTSGNAQLLAAPNDTVWFDFGEPLRMSGVRLHERTNNIVTAKVYGTNEIDGDATEWKLLGETKNNNAKTNTITFKKNYAYRYIKIQYALPTQVYTFLNEIAILAPGNHLTSSDVIAVDTMSGSDAEFTFDIMEGEEIVSFKDAENADVAYTLENGTLKIANAYLNTLANGEYTFTVKFTNEQTFTLKVTKSDSSKVNYRIYGNNNSNDLVLKNAMGKTVSAVTVVNGDVRADVAFIQADDKITVKRQLFRRATDLYSTMDVDKTGKVNVEVKFDDDSVATYEVTVEAEWVTVPSTGVTATYAQDEIAPNGWKVRISSGGDINAGPFPLIKAPYGMRDTQNWHTYFSAIDGTTYGDSTTEIGHYFELDFGENPEAYNGIRHLERAGGSTWNINVTITAKNEGGQWVEIYNAKPTYKSIGTYTDDKGTVNRYQCDMLFAEPVTYRYVRIHMRSTNSHITADNIKVLKETARLTSAETVTGDINEAEDAKFTFYVPAGATVTSVTNGDAVVDAASYTFVDGVLTIKADYVATLGENTTLTAAIGSAKFDLTIIRKDIYAATYAITSEANVRGSEDLVLVIPEGKVPTGITYGDKTLAVDPEVIPARLVVGEKSLTIKRYAIRDLDDIFDKTEMKITVNFEDETSKEYTVTLTKEGKALTGLNTEAFLEDEILPAEGAWTITASPSNGEGEHINNAFAKKTNDYNWHSAYSEAKNAAGNTIAMQDSTTSRLYIDVDFGKETNIGGLRYYERKNHDSGLWNGVSVYGKNAAGNWVLLKSQSFDTAALKDVAAGVVDVYFAEVVKYKEVRIIVDTTSLSTAHAITFLNKIPAPTVPEDKVNIQVTPTTGGNVTVNQTPTQGDNYVDANQEVTFEANADVTGEGVGFMYWVEANTGKILGKDTSLTVKSASGKDIKAVFADPASFEVFVSFFGRNANSVIAHSYVKKGEVPKIPSNDKLYTTGYEFKYWTNADGVEMDMTETVDANTEFYAFYEAKTTKQSKITVVGGKVRLNNNGDTASTEATYAYDTPVKVIANEAEEGMKFSHWEIAGEIVSYEKTYKFFAPDADITVTAVFVASDAEVKEKINITMTKTLDSINGVAVASFLTTRYVPTGVEVLETGVIYVKDASYGTLAISEIGKTSANGKAVKVATCDKTTSGQYKLTASYGEFGIKAVGFITYVEDGAVKTIYTEALSQN